MSNTISLWYFWKITDNNIISLLIYPWLLPRDILLKLTSPYNRCFSYIECFLFSVYLLVMKFSIISESIIAFPIFSLIIIFICNWAVLVEAAFLLAGAVPQYSSWLLPSEESSNFSTSLRNVFFDYIVDCSHGIFRIFCVCSRSYSCLLYKITIVFVCSL